MRQIAVELQGNGSFDLFTLGMITTDEIRQYVSNSLVKRSVNRQEPRK